MQFNKTNLSLIVWTVVQVAVHAQILTIQFSLNCKSVPEICDFELLKLIGKEGHGEVYKVSNNGIEMALKIGSKNDTQLRNELRIYKYLKTIVDMRSPEVETEKEGLARIYGFGVIIACSDAAVAVEFLGRDVMLMMLLGKDLYKLKQTFSSEELQDIRYQMMRSLNFIHRHKVAHNDVKLGNFLTVIVDPAQSDIIPHSATSAAEVRRRFKVFLIDFGDATIGEARSIHVACLGGMWGTMRYWSLHVHEVFDNRGVNDYVQTPGSREDDLVAFTYSVIELEFELPWRFVFNEFRRLGNLSGTKLDKEGGEKAVNAKRSSEYEKGLNLKKKFPTQIAETLEDPLGALLLEIYEYGCERYSTSEGSSSKNKKKKVSMKTKERDFLDRLQPKQLNMPVAIVVTTPATNDNVKKGNPFLKCFK